jgi:hypothetical protein
MDFDDSGLQIGNGPRNSLTIAHDCPGGVKLYSSDCFGLHRCKLDLAVEEIRTTFFIEVRLSAFRDFVLALDAFCKSLTGTVLFDDHESALELEMKMDKHGHLAWLGKIRRPGPIPRATLDFVLEDEQTSLPLIVKQAGAILEDMTGEPLSGCQAG